MKIHLTTVLLLCSLIFAIGSDWSIPSCIFTACMSILVLADVIPKLWRCFHASKRNTH
nr:MAG TPA: hypothetical protein [Caudoviricetes sp.]